jgi:hypothetical protein
MKGVLSGGRKRPRRRPMVYWFWLGAIGVGAFLLTSAVVARI